MINLKFEKHINYSHIIKKSQICLNQDPDSVDINIIIPKLNRDLFLRPVVDYFRKSAEQAGKRICVYVVEHDVSPKSVRGCENLGVNYIHIPKSPKARFNKCLCFNVGFLVANKTRWTLFHDIDILPPLNFIHDLSSTISETDRNWIQPFRGKSVCYLDASTTNSILVNRKIFNLNELRESVEYRRGTPGAPGGSICIRSSVFQEIGGYDPEVFTEYSPEDQFIWLKLEAFSANIKQSKRKFHCHYGAAEYMLSDMYHMYHLPNTNNGGPHVRKLNQDFISSFLNLSYEEQLEFLKKCRRCLI